MTDPKPAVLRRDRHGFRLRGDQMTRIETFSDAAFAFAVSLLVIAADAVPASFDQLTDALLGVPAFALAFALIMSFWVGHWSWSRRFGLEDASSILLSCVLVFLVLVFVYPLRYLAALFTYYFSGGRLSPTASINPDQLHDIFAIYGAGYVAMALIIIALNAHALRLRDQLDLDRVEVFIARSEMRAWTILASVGALSVTLALALPVSNLMLPGWIYMLLPVLMSLNGTRTNRRLEAIRAEVRAPGAGRSRPDRP
jgi:uncharacterized membrane protein